jgi:hypothetical protein
MPKKNTNGAKTKDGRTRNWTFIVYPESAPENWRDVISEEHVQWIESPLHDADENADGEQKKPHWHVAILNEGPKSYEQMKKITDSVKATIPQPVNSVQGLVRYMVHMDNPEKKQYDKSLIRGYGGVDMTVYFRSNSSTRYMMIAEMRNWVSDNECVEFSDLFDYAAAVRTEDWFPLLCDNSAYIMGEYIKSRRHKQAYTPIISNECEKGENINDG